MKSKEMSRGPAAPGICGRAGGETPRAVGQGGLVLLLLSDPGAGIPTQQGTEVSRQPCRVPGRRPEGQGGARAGQPGWNSVMESLWNSLAVPQARQDCNKHLL